MTARRLGQLSLCLLVSLALPGEAEAQRPARPLALASRQAGGSLVPLQNETPQLPLALEGFCPVTLRDRQQWQPGDAAFAVQFDGRQYWFAGRRELEIFAAAPMVYAPVLGGDCIVSFAKTGERVPGRPELGVTFGGRVYFFAGAERRDEFMAAPARFTDADLVDGGQCIVTRVEKRRDAAGLPETAVLVGGLRRQFAGAYERSLYLQNPQRYNAASAAPDTPLPSDPAYAASAAGSEASPAPTATALLEADEVASTQTEETTEAGATDARDDSVMPDAVMGGYCPVTIRTKGQWVRGRYDDVAQVDNLMFLTAGREAREAFLADPAQYIPALGGMCVVSYADLGETVRGSVFHASLYPEHQGRLFLFADEEAKATFDAGPERYASLDLAASGMCVVTLAESGQSTPGFAEFAVWHKGLLYRFASAEQKAKFLAAPEKYAADDEPAAAQPVAQ
jgi:YHS domain-containing protein